MNNDSITISKEEYYELLRAQEILSRLENGGVDNWQNYSESVYGADLNEEDMEDWEERVSAELGLSQ
jgi:hypothetical protein